MTKEIIYDRDSNKELKTLFILILVNLLFGRLNDYFRVFNTNLILIEPLFLLFLIAVFIKSYFYKISIFKSSLKNYFMIYLVFNILFAVISIAIFGNDLSRVLGAFRRTCVFPLIFFIAYEFGGNKNSLKNFQKMLVLFLIILIPYTIIFNLLGFELYVNGYFQVFDHPEGWAASYFIFLFIAERVLHVNKSQWISAFALIAIIVVLLTLKRGIWLSTIIGVIITYSFVSDKIKISRILKSFSIVVIFLVFIVIIAEGIFEGSEISDAFTNRIETTMTNVDEITEPGIGGTFAWRLAVYAQGISYFLENPILGKGLGFEPVFFIPKVSGELSINDSIRFHNAYLEVLVLSGIFGLVVFLLLHIKFIKVILKGKKVISKDKLKFFIAGFTLYLVGMIWAATANTITVKPNIAIFLYFIMGILTREADNALDEFNPKETNG